MSRMLLDLKAAARAAVRSRFVSILAILAFALGIGITTAVFSIFNGVLLEPLPFPHPEQLVAVYDTQPACTTCPASFPKYHDWRERNQVFSDIGGLTQKWVVLTGGGEPARLFAAQTTASFGDVFGVRPLLGRWYTEREDVPGGPKVVAALARPLVRALRRRSRRRRPDADARRRAVRGDRRAAAERRLGPQAAEVFLPLQRKLDPATRGNHFLQTFARLKPGVTVPQRRGRDARARRHAGARVRQQPRHRRPLVHRGASSAACARRSTCCSAPCSSCC